MEFLLRRALTRRVHPTCQNAIAANAISSESVGNILRELASAPFEARQNLRKYPDQQAAMFELHLMFWVLKTDL
jgi:hypothetical protein